MSVIVKGMEIPKSCYECGLYQELSANGSCWAKDMRFGREDAEWLPKTRPNWCPLRTLPNVHGDLIDRDALPSRVEWEDIVDAPAIVEAEGLSEPLTISGTAYFINGVIYLDPDFNIGGEDE